MCPYDPGVPAEEPLFFGLAPLDTCLDARGILNATVEGIGANMAPIALGAVGLAVLVLALVLGWRLVRGFAK